LFDVRPGQPTLPVVSGDGGWETWSWDETLFAGTAPFYVQGRPPYAEGLADALADALALDGRGRLLDVGCGPGVVTLRLAGRFQSVVGLDPDGGMLAEAARLAAEQGIGNASWVKLRAEALPADLGNFRAVTFAASFHWMDRLKVAAAVRDMLEPGGAAVQVDAPAYRPDELTDPLAYPRPPLEAIEQLRRRYLGPDRRAGQSIRNTSPSGEDEIFQAAGFRPADEVLVPDGRLHVRTIDDMVASVFSNSSSAPHLLGDDMATFEAELRALLGEASPEGKFAIRLPANVLRVWRPA